ncbi:ApeP family dehydratase [Marinobacter mangrovi]|uniref:ApeP family dehydratase n=1 Tax=Marinobacter mangrovi TaxID=2803918 RepID=UPI001932A2FB|nr:hotdog family protein [Marinobacter mangrovi]
MKPTFDVAEVVPQSATMSLLTHITDYGDDHVRTAVTIGPDSLFCDRQGVPAWVGLEYMAQSIGAFAGIHERLNGQAPQIGFLVGSRRYQCNQPVFPVGTKLEITAERSYQADNGLGVFNCTIEGDGILATAALNVYQPDDVDAFLQGTDNE